MKKASSLVILVAGISFSLVWAQGTAAIPDPVKKIFKRSCGVAGCHQGKYPAMNLNLEPGKIIPSAFNAVSQEKPSLKIIDAQSPDNSYLLMKIRGDQDIAGKRMPLRGSTLKDEEVQAIRNWVQSLKDTDLPTPSSSSSSGHAPNTMVTGPAFWGTRLINLPTTRTIDKGRFLIRISHRFLQAFRSGSGSFYGLDGPSIILLGFGYGISDRLGVSLGRTNSFQEMELGLHWLLLDQDDRPGLPLSAAVYAGESLVTQLNPGQGLFDAENFKFNLQLCLSSRLTDRFSVLVVPCFSTNADHWEPASQNTLALGLGGRFMFLKDMSLIAEWMPVLSGYKTGTSGWGFGIEKKIGGHVFQFFALNSVGLTSDQFIPGGDLRLRNGDFRLGFNIFRTF